MEHILLTETSINPQKIFQIRREVENICTGKHINNDNLVNYIRETNSSFFIVSNNLQATVEGNIKETGITHKFKKIIGCDTYNSNKPSTLSWQKLVNEFDLNIFDTLVVGDSPKTDGIYARNIGLPYFQISSFT